MITLALLLQAAVPPPPPQSWPALPPFPLPAFTAGFDPSPYVRREVEAGRCRAFTAGQAQQVEQPVALLVDAGGAVQRIVPLATGCPTVEQYTVGLVSTLARRGLGSAGLRPGWYRYVAVYRWAG